LLHALNVLEKSVFPRDLVRTARHNIRRWVNQ